MIRQKNFAAIGAPAAGAGFTKSVTPSAASQTLVLDANSLTKDENDCYVTNDSNSTCFVRFSIGADTAVLTDMPVRAGAAFPLSMGRADRVSVISTGTPTGTIYFTPGLGS